MKKGMNSKAQTWQFIIMGLLGVAVLVFGIWLISTGSWRDYISSNTVNMDAAVFGCRQKCNIGESRGYCTEPAAERGVITEKGAKPLYISCKQLESIPNSGLTCDKFDCSNIDVVSCAQLTYLCSGSVEGKCSLQWLDKASYDKNKVDKVIFKEISDVTASVTDLNDKKTASDSGKPYCVKIVLN